MEFIVLPENEIDIEIDTFYPKNCIGHNLTGEFKLVKSNVYKGKPVEFQFSKGGCNFFFPNDTKNTENVLHLVKLDVDFDTIFLQPTDDKRWLCSYEVDGRITEIRTSNGKFPGVEIFFKDDNNQLFMMEINFYFFYNIKDPYNFKVDMIEKTESFSRIFYSHKC